MCHRNLIEYACPSCHVHLNTILDFTFCENAATGPIPRHCADTKSRVVKSGEWCVDCHVETDVENEGRRWEIKRDGEGNDGSEAIRPDRARASSLRRGKGERLGFLRRWAGYTGRDGRQSYRDDVPQ
jgi:hypothetical protein